MLDGKLISKEEGNYWYTVYVKCEHTKKVIDENSYKEYLKIYDNSIDKDSEYIDDILEMNKVEKINNKYKRMIFALKMAYENKENNVYLENLSWDFHHGRLKM